MVEKLLPHLSKRQEEKEVVCEILEPDIPRIRREDPLSDGVYQHPRMLGPAGWLEVQFLLVDDNPQVLTELKELLMMLEE